MAPATTAANLGANHPAFLEALFAAAKLGAVFAPINHRFDDAAIAQIVRDFAPAAAIVDAGSIRVPLEVPARIVVGDDYEALIGRSSADAIHVPVSGADLCMLPHTSGTTGTPKGIMLTHGNLTWNVINFLSLVDFRADDVTIAIAPFFRTGGLGVNVLPVLFKGGTVVVPEAPSPEEILRLLESRRITIGFGNPDLLDAVARSPRWRDADLGTIRVFMTGGAPVPERLLRTYLERGITFQQGYGLSEASPFVLLLDAESAFRKLGSAGKPPLFVEVRVRRPDRSECAPNETGELVARGPNVMAGYWNRSDLTRKVLDDEGWLATGDAARIDDEGFVWVVDRVADGYATPSGVVYPGDVERVLATHGAVADAGVVGIDGRGIAFVVPGAGSTPTPDELLAVCAARLPVHAVPAVVHMVERIPRSTVGKLLRHELAAMAKSSAR
jgi:fatty-acyl-CoA synthase